MSLLAVELLETLRQIGPAALAEVRADYQLRAKMRIVDHAEPVAIDEAWSELSKAGRIKLANGLWNWVPDRKATPAPSGGERQRSLFG